MDLSKEIQSMCMNDDKTQCTVIMCDGSIIYRKIDENTTYDNIEKQIEEELEYI